MSLNVERPCSIGFSMGSIVVNTSSRAVLIYYSEESTIHCSWRTVETNPHVYLRDGARFVRFTHSGLSTFEGPAVPAGDVAL